MGPGTRGFLCSAIRGRRAGQATAGPTRALSYLPGQDGDPRRHATLQGSGITPGAMRLDLWRVRGDAWANRQWDSPGHSSECQQLSSSELLRPVGGSAGPHTVTARALRPPEAAVSHAY